MQVINLSGISSGAGDEVQTLQVTATSSNPAVVGVPTVNYTSPNHFGSVGFAPVAGASGESLITITVSDGAAASHTISRVFRVTVANLNRAPTLDPIADVTVDRNAPQQTVLLTGISSGAASEAQPVQVTASSSDPTLVPHPTVAYTAPSFTGALFFTPAANRSGQAVITVAVYD